MPHNDAPPRRLSLDDLKVVHLAERQISVTCAVVREIDEDHPALEHLRAAWQAVERVAYGYEPA